MYNELNKKWLRPKAIFQQLGISLSRQARLRSDGKISYHKLGSFVYYDADVINQMIEDAKVC